MLCRDDPLFSLALLAYNTIRSPQLKKVDSFILCVSVDSLRTGPLALSPADMASFGLAGGGGNTQVNLDEIESNTPWMAASEGNLPLLQAAMQKYQLPTTAADESGYTLLHASASYTQVPVMQWLLQQGADPNATDQDGDSALHYAGTSQAAKILIESGRTNIQQTNKTGKTAFQAKMEELNEMKQDEDVEDDDDDLLAVMGIVEYLNSLSG